jgi:1-deoxy-D-xylulose-5-phosphate synthase
MKLGTGLSEFEVHAPRRFFDVGIAEQHAITFAGALASNGMRPFVSIYSTFLQRAVDQLIHDIGIMNLPVRILIDRAGIVGSDGETHHGLFDIAIIKNIPNFILLAPSNSEELRDMIHYAASYDKGPVAIRYPRGFESERTIDVTRSNPFNIQKVQLLTRGRDIAIFTFGDMVPAALETERILRDHAVSTAVVNLLTIKPLDVQGIDRVLKEVRYFITLENGIISGGAGESLLSKINAKYRGKLLFAAGFPDEFIPHGSVPRLFTRYGIDASSIAKRILKAVR